MRTAVLAIALSLLATSAYAQVTVRVVNNSTQTVRGMNTFPIGADGHYIDDNIGGFFSPVVPGETGTAELTGSCGNVLAIVTLVDETEMRSIINTCKDRTLSVTD